MASKASQPRKAIAAKAARRSKAEAVPKVSDGLSAAKSGFMDGTDGKPSPTWTRTSVPVFGAGYGPYYGTPGLEISRERAAAAAVTTDLLTSNALIATLVENLATYAVGTGMTLSSRPDHTALGITARVARELANSIERAWQSWANNPVECDASSRHTLHQLANANFKSYLLTGEGVFVIDWQQGNGGQTGTKVKLLDSRQIDQSINRVGDGGNIVQGVQFDKRGRVTGYWIRPYVLGSINAAPQAVFVRAQTSWGRQKAVHLFDLLTPGQIRGISPLIAALTPAHAKGTLREFVLQRALIQNMTAATVTSSLPSHQALNALSDGVLPTSGLAFSLDDWSRQSAEHYQDMKIDLRPGGVAHLLPGEELKLHRAETPDTNYEPFDKSLGREAAKAAGSSAEDVSGYYGDTSFSASRLAMEGPWRINKRRRAAIVEPFYRAVFAAWLEEACETGLIELPNGAPAFWEAKAAYTQSSWRGEGKPVADPHKAALADLLEVENGFKTMEAVLGERGLDFEDVVAQRKTEKEQLEAAGLYYPVPKNRDDWKPEGEPDDEALK